MEYVKLGDLYKISKGKKVEALGESQSHAIRYIQIDDLRSNDNIKYCLNDNKYVVADEDDLIIAWDGANAGTIGYGLNGAIGSTLARLRTNSKDICTSFIGEYMKLKSKTLRDKCTGATIPHIQRKVLEEVLIPKYNLSTQKKISKVLDKAQELIDKRKEQIEACDELIKSQFVEMFGDSLHNTKSWEIKKLGEIFKVGSSKRIYQREQTKSGVPFLRISDIVRRIKNGKNECELYISDEQYESFKKKSLVPSVDDILVTSRGTLGLCYIMQKSDRFYFQDGMISWLKKDKMKISSIYLKYLFQMSGFRKQVEEVPDGSTVNYLSIYRLSELEVMFPPIELQNQFTSFVKRVDKLKSQLQQSLTELETNFNALMQRAFNGELF